ncbi:MAG: DsbA family protein [Pirellulaceae bacterium]|nr:DsbA family protein [Pirellulaceae bacterium]
MHEINNVLEVFTDFVCPWCYLGEKQLQEAAADTDVTLRYIYFPLHPETPAKGMTLEELFAGRGMDVAATQQQLGTMMRGEGLDYGPRTHTFNSRLAQQLAKYIAVLDTEAGTGNGDQFRAEVFLAYFARGENIAKPDVLQGICNRIGNVDIDIEKALSDSTAAQKVNDDWAYCRKMNVTGVPAFRFGEQWVHGCQGVPALESLIRVERVD